MFCENPLIPHPKFIPDQRKILDHTPPAFVRTGAWFFITLCCQQRGTNQLCVPNIASKLIADGIFYHNQHRWNVHILLLMPDHLHLIANFPTEVAISCVIRDWKRLTARGAKVAWQKNYFDHRVRPNEGMQQKTDYIRQNPVRANLISNANDWPHFVDYTMLAVAPNGLP